MSSSAPLPLNRRCTLPPPDGAARDDSAQPSPAMRPAARIFCFLFSFVVVGACVCVQGERERERGKHVMSDGGSERDREKKRSRESQRAHANKKSERSKNTPPRPPLGPPTQKKTTQIHDQNSDAPARAWSPAPRSPASRSARCSPPAPRPPGRPSRPPCTPRPRGRCPRRRRRAGCRRAL
jgi:hypothetical protein